MKKLLLLLIIFFSSVFVFAEKYSESEMQIFKTIDYCIDNFPQTKDEYQKIVSDAGFIFYSTHENYSCFGDTLCSAGYGTIFCHFLFESPNRKTLITTLQKILTYYKDKYKNENIIFSETGADDYAYFFCTPEQTDKGKYFLEIEYSTLVNNISITVQNPRLR